MITDTIEERLQGLSISTGIAVGKPFFLTATEEGLPEYDLKDTLSIEKEISRYQNAIENSQKKIDLLQQQLREDPKSESVSILEAQRHMMRDPLVTTEVEREICRLRKNAEYVCHQVMTQYHNRFFSMKDPFFRERAREIQDIFRWILTALRTQTPGSLKHIPQGAILIAPEFSACDALAAHALGVGAFISSRGGSSSHAAIIARSKGTPYISEIDIKKIDNHLNNFLIVDGLTGEIVLSPTGKTLAEYQNKQQQLHKRSEAWQRMRTLSAETFDGYAVRLSANVETPNELELLHQHGSSGVGLFRSEYLFLAHNQFPNEEEQFAIYREVVEKMQGLPIVIRAFDIGGDKVPNHHFVAEGNPFLGCRAIRFLLREREIFKTQLRAVLRAGAYGDVSLLFPMIASLSELVEAKQIIKEAQSELDIRHESYASHIRIGCMIEVPSAALMADLLAKECDFLSIGTNDLVQYTLAVDRSNYAMRSLYNPSHPSVLRLIKLVVSEANQHAIPVAVCGEIAADPRFTPLLLGLGVHELSVASRYLPTVKQAIRNTSIVAAAQLADKALTLKTAGEIEMLLTEEYKRFATEDCLYTY